MVSSNLGTLKAQRMGRKSGTGAIIPVSMQRIPQCGVALCLLRVLWLWKALVGGGEAVVAPLGIPIAGICNTSTVNSWIGLLGGVADLVIGCGVGVELVG